MAIAEMSKMTLLGKIEERDVLLNALQRTGAVQVFSCEENEEAPFLRLPDSEAQKEAE